MDHNKRDDDLTAHQTDEAETAVTTAEENALNAETLTTDIEARQPVPVVSGAISTELVPGIADTGTDTVMVTGKALFGSDTEIAPNTSPLDTAKDASSEGSDTRALGLPMISDAVGSQAVRPDVRSRLMDENPASTAEGATVEMIRDEGHPLNVQHGTVEETARSDMHDPASPVDECGPGQGGVMLDHTSIDKAGSEVGTALTEEAKRGFDAQSVGSKSTHDTVAKWRAGVDKHPLNPTSPAASSSGSITSSDDGSISKDAGSTTNSRKPPAKPLKPADPILLSRATSSILSALGSLVPSSASMWHGAGWALGKLGDGAEWAGDKLGDGARRWCWSQEDYDSFKGNKQWDVTSGKGSAPVSLVLKGREFTIAGSTVGLGGSKGALGLYKGVKSLVDGIEERQEQKSAGRGARGGEHGAGTARSVIAGVA